MGVGERYHEPAPDLVTRPTPVPSHSKPSAAIGHATIAPVERSRDRGKDPSAQKREPTRGSDEILAAIDELHGMESEKRRLPISTPGFHRLADDVAEEDDEESSSG